MNKTAPILTALIASLCFASAAHAQSAEPTLPGQHHGFYLRATSGPGFASLSGDGPTRSASISGFSGTHSLSMGGSIGRGLVLAGTLQASTLQATFKGGPFRNATLDVDGSNIAASHSAYGSFTELGLLIDWYPNISAGWHVGASAGLGVIGIVNNADDSTLIGVSPAGTLFGGYDFPLGRDWSLGLSLVASGASAASMKHASNGDDANYRLTPVSVGLQASLLYF